MSSKISTLIFLIGILLAIIGYLLRIMRWPSAVETLFVGLLLIVFGGSAFIWKMIKQ